MRPTLATAAREYIWLYDLRHGIGHREIAARAGLSIAAVRAGIKRARAMDGRPPAPTHEPDGPVDMGLGLIPLFPMGAFTPASRCPHGDAGPASPFCCMVCHACHEGHR